MSDAPKNPLKRFLPSDEEIDRAMEEALRDASAGGIPVAGPTFQVLRENTLAKGNVLLIDKDRVVVDLSSKAEGIIPLAEFGDLTPAAGDPVEAWVMALEDPNGQVSLSILEAQRQKVWAAVSEGAREGAILRGKVQEAVKGGVLVDVGLRAFMPARECDVRYVEDLSALIGKNVEVQVLEADEGGRNVVVSRRAVLQKERSEKQETLYQTLAEGQTHHGIVTNLTDFGAFVDIGGADGLVHKSDLAWGRVEKVSDVVQAGQSVEVVVLKFDREADKISLGLKQVGPSPWDQVPLRFPVGTRVTGEVTILLDFGALVELETGIQGLVHVSEMRWGQRVNKPSEVVTIGQEVEVEVIQVDLEKKKIGLSMKRIEENPWASLDQVYPFATIVNGKVTRIEEFGAFIQLDDTDIEGLVHVSEISWIERPQHPKEMLSSGDHVTAIVIGSDAERQRLALSIKKTDPDPWWDVEDQYPVGSTVTGTVVRLADFGVFVQFKPGLEGLVHVSNLGHGPGTRPRDVVGPGDSIRVEVLEVSEESRRMALRRIESEEEPD